jgi:hypothetical protein
MFQQRPHIARFASATKLAVLAGVCGNTWIVVSGLTMFNLT